VKPLIGFRPNFTGMIPGWSSTKVVQTVPVGCLSRSQRQKIGFQNAIFKNLVWNYKAQSFYIWCITSSKGPLPIFGGQHLWVVLCKWLNCDLLTFSSGERPRAFVPSCLLDYLWFLCKPPAPSILLWTVVFSDLESVTGHMCRYTSK